MDDSPAASETRTRPAPTVDVVEPGPLLARTLAAFQRRDPAHARTFGGLLGITLLLGSVAVVLAAVGGLVFLIGAATSWLSAHVVFFTHHPRLGAFAAWGLGASVVGVAFVAGRASVRDQRPRSSPPRPSR